jgi:hypothetical protein
MTKYIFWVSIFLLCCITQNIANADSIHTKVAEYNLILNFDKIHQKIIARLHNQSNINLHIHKDASPLSLLLSGAKLAAFEDSPDLKRIPIYYSIGSNRDVIKISAGEINEDEEDLEGVFGKRYCDIFKNNSILVFWSYSARSDEYILPPSEGVFRISKNDVNC